MNKRDIAKSLIIIGGDTLGSALHRKLEELNRGIEVVSLNDISKPEPMLIKNYRMDDIIYNPNQSSKRGSKFTPKKKKRKKR